MRLVTIAILNLLLLNSPLAPCQEGASCMAEASVAEARHTSCGQEEKQCCADSAHTPDDPEEDHCPAFCQCTCCPAVAVLADVNHHLASCQRFEREPALYTAHYHFDFHHLIWQPPQF